jgi:hypothetical protein
MGQAKLSHCFQCFQSGSDVTDIDELLRGADEVIQAGELAERIAGEKPLRVIPPRPICTSATP